MHDDQPRLNPQDIEAYLLGYLPDDRVESLDRVLHDDPAALRQLAQAMQLMSLVRQEFAGQAAYQATHQQEPLLEDFNALLKDLGAREAAAQAEVVTISVEPIASIKEEDAGSLSMHELGVVAGYVFRKVVTSKPFIVSASAAAAAVVLLATLFLVDWSDSTTNPIANQIETPEVPSAVDINAQTVATLTAATNAHWAEGALAPGSLLKPNQRLTLTAGTAQITTNRGAIAVLQAPCTIELIDHDNALRLHAGKLVGICETQSSQGFLVRTPHMDITDLGTRFGVDVARGLATEVHVFDGEVIVAPPQAAGTAKPKRLHLTANHAVRSDATHDAIASITPDFEKFDPSLSTYLLPGTGFGLAEGGADLNWQIVADGNGPLETPIQVKVQFTNSAHWDATGNDPDKAQNLIFVNGYPEYNFPKYDDLKPPSVTLRSTFELPDTVELNSAALRMVYASGNGMHALRINGQAVEPLAKQSNAGIRKGTRHAATIPVTQTALKHGKNVIEVELNNKFSGPVGWYLFWEIQPTVGPIQPTNELIPITE